jgi:hypothetical protein
MGVAERRGRAGNECSSIGKRESWPGPVALASMTATQFSVYENRVLLFVFFSYRRKVIEVQYRDYDCTANQG